MELIGDLERWFATSLYPLRIPIAIALGLGLVALALVARRRKWLDTARRHPGRTALAVVALLAVTLPSAWYLGSPLFIRTALVEPPVTTSPASAAPVIETPGAGGDGAIGASRSGTFTGADDFHHGSGTARLIETAPGVWSVRFEDFSVQNGPDLFVYLSPDPAGYADGAVELGQLKATDGSFNTPVPSGTDVSVLRSVVIWCREFAVQFAFAPLE